MADGLPQVQAIVRRAARALTGADGATFVLREGDQCFYADEDAIAPLWKGRRFPMSICISGWAMLHRRRVAIEDIYADDRIPHDAYRPTFVKSLAMVPIRSLDPIGAIGNYWAERHRPTEQELGLLQALADSTAVAIARVQLLEHLEQRVAERTAALTAEVERRRRAEEEVRELLLTDELTGVASRRGFLLRAEQLRRLMRRRRAPSLLVFADIDDLKRLNDTFGHDAGDRLIREAAGLLVGAFRDGDVVGRLGGDEFVAFLPDLDDATEVAQRVAGAVLAFNAHRLTGPLSLSVGAVVVDPDERRPLADLLTEADAAMYRAKRAGKAQATAVLLSPLLPVAAAPAARKGPVRRPGAPLPAWGASRRA
jgi:diguanylate cyclase (GGDEF)-like protein